MIDLSTFRKLWMNHVRKREKSSKMDIVKYWNERAHDYAEAVKLSNFELGEKVKNILLNEGVISNDCVVLDIGAGPGTIAIPLAKVVKEVIAIEPSREMIKYLKKFSIEYEINNIEVINARWEELSNTNLYGKFDLVLSSHVLWIFPDIDHQINRIINAAKSAAALLKLLELVNGLRELSFLKS